ncbi:MAG: Na+/H+ antiporter NhaA [Marinifilaceae bacterium]|nr:Na+/H+ antiporter NhaA [Marinifilaceae bacterium]
MANVKFEKFLDRISYKWDVLSTEWEYKQERVNGGIILLVVAFITLLIANSPLKGWYDELLSKPLMLVVGDYNLLESHHGPMTFLDFINDGLMTIFFFSVGLEIKREILVGELHSLKKAMLPIIAAVGGMLIPVMIFFALAPSDPEYITRGCAIPMATDIAFSLGVLSLLGSRVPKSLKIFLATLAVADDIGGILVIATCYSSGLEWNYFLLALIPLTLLYAGGRLRIYNWLFYIFCGFLTWYFFVHWGVHATIAGVIVAFMIPAHHREDVAKVVDKVKTILQNFPENKHSHIPVEMLTRSEVKLLVELERTADHVISPLQRIDKALQPIINMVVMPIFAFANAGVTLGGLSVNAMLGVSLVIAIALCFGKTIGIFTFTWISIKSGWINMPKGMNLKNLLGLSMLGGIGFTVSLFIANLSYGNYSADILNQAKFGIICGSIISGIVGYCVLNKVLPKADVKSNGESEE